MTTTDTAPASPRTWHTLLPFLLAVTVVAALGGWAAGAAGATYRDLALPAFAPPSWLFGPVWTALYLTIAVAGWLVWRADGWNRALTAWVVQLLLNLAWTPLFFGLGLIGLALVEIVLLLVAVAVTIALFRRTSPTAAWLLLPYLGWVGFATLLNASIWVLNR